MFSEYILGQYLTLISDLISLVEEELEIISEKGSLNNSWQKTIHFSETEEAANTNCSNKHLY